MIATGCPSTRQISDYLLGKMDDASSEEVDQHLEQCTECRAAAESLEKIPDSLLDRLRGPATADWEDDDPDLSPALERIRAGVSADESEAVESVHPTRLRDYRLLAPLGEGGMGRVYCARHERLQRDVALKLLSPRQSGNPQAENRFEREMRAIGRLTHEHIVAALDAGLADGVYYLAMELIDGCDGRELTRRLGSLPIADACELVRQAALGLEHAHRHGLIHRDVKPSNLLIDRSGNVKLADLGLALATDDAATCEPTPAGNVLGTWDYIAPEQLDGSPAEPRTDLYALGATLFALLTGRAPFAADGRETPLGKLLARHQEPPPALVGVRIDVPRPLSDLVDRLLAKDPARRPASAAELSAALEPYCAGADLAALVARAMSNDSPRDGAAAAVSPPPPIEGRRRSVNTRRWAAAAAVILATGIGVGLAAIGTDDESQTDDNSANAKSTDAPAKPSSEAAQAAAAERQQDAAKAWKLPVRQTNTLGMELKLIPSGEFLMGSTAVEMRRAITLEQQQVPPGWPMHYFIRKVEVEFPQHSVKLTKPFLIGAHEVTVGQWDKFVAESGYKRQVFGEPDVSGPEGFGRDGRKPENDLTPMTFVTWDDAVAFCDWLGAKEGRTYRLPTEAEWEYACRAGTTTRWFSGDDESSLRDYAWTLQNCGRVRDVQTENSADVLPQPVGGKKPNAFGLYDMTGNVWEWCRDNFRETYYPNSPAEDPPGPEMLVVGPFNKTKVLRGGGNGFRENESRSAARWFLGPFAPRNYIGFRVVCELPQAE